MHRFQSGKVTMFITPAIEQGTVAEGCWQGVVLLDGGLVSIQDFVDFSVKSPEDAFTSIIEYLLPDEIIEETDIERNQDGTIVVETIALSEPVT